MRKQFKNDESEYIRSSRQIGLAASSTVSSAVSKVPIASFPVAGAPPFDLLLAHFLTPNGSIAANEVVRPARKTPTANGRKQRYGLAVKSHFPTNRTNRRHHFQTTSAKAVVDGRCVRDRYI